MRAASRKISGPGVRAPGGASLAHNDAAQLRQTRLQRRPNPRGEALARRIFKPFYLVQIVVVEPLENRCERRLDAKSITQPVVGSTSPDTCTSIWNECPCSRAHLCVGGTPVNRCAASIWNILKMSMESFVKADRRPRDNSRSAAQDQSENEEGKSPCRLRQGRRSSLRLPQTTHLADNSVASAATFHHYRVAP